jgi:hypothetical protein
MARAATSPELVLYRSQKKLSKYRCIIIKPTIVYRARINQTFTTLDQVLSVVFDGGSGTLANVLPDMEVWIGSALDGHDKGICRLRDKDATHFYLSETSEIAFANDDFVTILAAFGVWARPARILEDGTVYMDEAEYSDQHENWDPQPNMGPDQVVELVDETVEVSFHAGTSFCPGSSIASYSWSCATASASSTLDEADVTFQFDTIGEHLVYLTLTATNGKTFFGVRSVYVWDKAHQPQKVKLDDPGRVDIDSGGWEISFTMFAGANMADVYDRAKVILLSDDFYDGTQAAIGPVVGSENIRFIGWIAKESHHLSSEQGSVTFTAYGAAQWMGRIPSWPDGVELVSGTPAAWTEVQNLTVDLGLYHWLRHRTTITRIMDVTLSGDTRISNVVNSSAQDLWSQLQDMTWAQIYARPGVNYLNQFSCQIHPSLIPTADRSYPTVMAITKNDYYDLLDFDRAIVDEVGIVDMSGIQVTGPDDGSAWFALAPGHSLPHYGKWDIQPNLLLASQAQVITLAGLYRSLKNNPYKSIPIPFKAAIELIDCFPNQRCTISIAAEDNIRGFPYSGGLIPVSIQRVQDEGGYIHTEVTFEAQTNESQSRVGDTPGSDPTDGPVTPSLPPIALPPIIIPGGPGEPTAGGPSTVMVYSPTYGWAFTTNFNSGSPNWNLMNGGLTEAQYTAINFGFVCPNGAVYTGLAGSGSNLFIARAPGVGQPWTIVVDYDYIHALYPGTESISAPNCNSLVPESVAFIAGGGGDNPCHIYVGSAGAFAQGSVVSTLNVVGSTKYAYTTGAISYGFGKWRYAAFFPWFVSTNAAHHWLFSPSGTVSSHADLPNDIVPGSHVYPDATPIIFMGRSSHVGMYRFSNNFQGALIFPDDDVIYLSENVGLMEAMASDPTGQLLMGRWEGNKGKSPDGGSSWSALPSLPPGNYYWAYAGPGTSILSSRWVAVSEGAAIRYSDNFGSTWLNREGDILAVFPTGGINRVLVIGF